MLLNLIGALLKESGALEAVEGYLLSALAAAQLKPPEQRPPGGERADVVAAALKSHFLHSEHLSLMQRRMLGVGWQQGLSAPRNGKEFWAFCSTGVVKVRWSSLAKGFIRADQHDHATIEIMLWLPLSAFPETWQPPPKT
jgi:hypothetical protein